MGSATDIQGFDYDLLDSETRIVVKQKTGEIRERTKRAADDIVAIGERLIEVKHSLGHGHFGGWLKAEFEWSETSALKMMRVATSFKSVQLTDLNIAPSALYLLASDSTPPEVRSQVISEAKSGKPVTHAAVKAKVAAAKPPNPKPPEDRKSSAQSAVTKESNPETAAPELIIAPVSVSAEWPDDDAGRAIPDDLLEPFQARERFDRAINLLVALKKEVNPLLGDANKVKPIAGGERLAAERQTVINHLDETRSLLKNARPYAVCPYCKGTLTYTGTKCSCKLGWVGKHSYDTAPSEMKPKKKK